MSCCGVFFCLWNGAEWLFGKPDGRNTLGVKPQGRFLPRTVCNDKPRHIYFAAKYPQQTIEWQDAVTCKPIEKERYAALKQQVRSGIEKGI